MCLDSYKLFGSQQRSKAKRRVGIVAFLDALILGFLSGSCRVLLSALPREIALLPEYLKAL